MDAPRGRKPTAGSVASAGRAKAAGEASQPRQPASKKQRQKSELSSALFAPHPMQAGAEVLSSMPPNVGSHIADPSPQTSTTSNRGVQGASLAAPNPSEVLVKATQKRKADALPFTEEDDDDARPEPFFIRKRPARKVTAVNKAKEQVRAASSKSRLTISVVEVYKSDRSGNVCGAGDTQNTKASSDVGRLGGRLTTATRARRTTGLTPSKEMASVAKAAAANDTAGQMRSATIAGGLTVKSSGQSSHLEDIAATFLAPMTSSFLRPKDGVREHKLDRSDYREREADRMREVFMH